MCFNIVQMSWKLGLWVCMYNCSIIPVVLYRCTIQLSQTEWVLCSPNESVSNGPLRSPNESVSNGPLRSPNESDVEFRLQKIRGLLACYKVWDFRFGIVYSKWGSQKMLFGRSSKLVTGRVMPGQCTASVPLATNRWLRQWVACAIIMLAVRSGRGQ